MRQKQQKGEKNSEKQNLLNQQQQPLLNSLILAVPSKYKMKKKHTFLLTHSQSPEIAAFSLQKKIKSITEIKQHTYDFLSASKDAQFAETHMKW